MKITSSKFLSLYIISIVLLKLLFLKSKYKYWVLPATLLFFIIPNIEQKSNDFFNKCVLFLNYTGELFHFNYIDMSVYFCVILPLVLYVPFVIKKFEIKTLKIIAFVIFLISFFYMILIYPFFKFSIESLIRSLFSFSYIYCVPIKIFPYKT